MRLVFVGDVMLGRLVNRALKHLEPNYPWGDTLPLFENADWRACNLECVISDRGVPWSVTPKAFHFRSDAKNVAVLRSARIDAVSLANNHVLDFEYEGMLEMLRVLNVAQIRHAGAGADLAAAARPAISTVAGLGIAFIAFTDNEPGWQATSTRPGAFYLPVDPEDERARMLFDVVSRARSQADIIVVSAHWGPNWGYEPLAEHVRFAHRLIDAGADIIFGHSGHVFRGIELYKRRTIIYCAGDFVDDYAVDEVERNDESFVFILETSKGRVGRILLHPTLIAGYQARLAQGEDAARIGEKMRQLCLGLDTPARWCDSNTRLEISTGVTG